MSTCLGLTQRLVRRNVEQFVVLAWWVTEVYLRRDLVWQDRTVKWNGRGTMNSLPRRGGIDLRLAMIMVSDSHFDEDLVSRLSIRFRWITLPAVMAS